ncbi:class I SAM-dependent rRNA methyltransferase [[Eubacterium] hominis]|uniref:class I SAM-dependent rRNA methyltransferase n=1 Tax=[Eubacterium] hominis TaxID=2764325 RepID=UPI003A4E597A
MKQERSYPFVTITKKGKKQLQQGHPWVYEGEVLALSDTISNGDIVDVFSDTGSYLGSGFYNANSKIRVRIFSDNANDVFDEAFWRRRLLHSYEYRKSVMREDIDDCRLIFGEADFFPGWTLDRFHDILVSQTMCLGIDQRKDLLYRLILSILKEGGQVIKGIYERNDIGLRKLEGMEAYKGWANIDGYPTPDSCLTQIVENGITYMVDVENGQKTGFFLDQKYNRLALSRIVKDKHVLDCCTHTGSFALNAAKGGATHVHAVDISDTAIEMAKENAKRNHLEDVMSFEVADVFECLKALKKKPRTYDVIILDPPAFTKSRETVSHALKGYREINTLAMKLLPRGGYLATCSCSHFMKEGLFKSMLHEAAEAAGVGLRQVEARQQSCDHPILWNVPETNYLKFYIFQIC